MLEEVKTNSRPIPFQNTHVIKNKTVIRIGDFDYRQNIVSQTHSGFFFLACVNAIAG